jgi:hypothetical protein
MMPVTMGGIAHGNTTKDLSLLPPLIGSFKRRARLRLTKSIIARAEKLKTRVFHRLVQNISLDNKYS